MLSTPGAKRIAFAFIALSALCCAPGPASLRAALAQNVTTQNAAALADGVVRITSSSDGKRRTGTGFIVQTTDDTIYIATAAHVVEGDKSPKVAFRPEPNTDYDGQVLKLEGGDPKGLALIAVRGNVRHIARQVLVLPLSSNNDLSGGDQVTAIGFPQGGGAWAVVPSSIASRDGRELVLAGNLGEGNSGGPLLKDGAVVGLVTVMQGQYGRATPAPIVRIAMEGWGLRLGAARAATTQTGAAQPSGTPSPPPQSPAAADAAGAATRTAPLAPPDAGSKGPTGSVRPSAVAPVSGRYAGQLQGMTSLGQTYVCGFAAALAQNGIEVSGQYQNTCGDQGVFAGQVNQGKLAGGTASQINGGYCYILIDIGNDAAALNGQYECLNGERGSFALVRQ